MDTLQQALANVYWIGGSPCSGKSSIANALAAAYGMQQYECDQAFYRHAKAIRPDQQPTFHAILQLSNDALWMRPVEQQTAAEIATYREEFPLILEDLLALPRSQPILAEGAALLPELVAPLLINIQQAIWIVPAPAFQLQYYSQREWAKDVVKDCSDPQQAYQNWMQRDIRFASFVRQAAEKRGLRTLAVDGQASIAENTDLVESHFQLVSARRLCSPSPGSALRPGEGS
jgi:2-phosphoglycerate kinase